MQDIFKYYVSMNLFTRFSFTIFCTTLFSAVMYGQCSDAGICMLKNHRTEVVKRYSVGTMFVLGRSGKTEDITYSTYRVDASASLNDDVRLSVSLPYNFQSGPKGDVDGIGDAIALIHYRIFSSNEYSLSLQAGMKFGTGNANNAPSLPQQYQSSLGSNDFLFGVIGSVGMYDITIGYQSAGERNNNAVTRLQRGDDLLLKVGTTIPAEPFSFAISYLLIHRLQESSVRDTTINGAFVTVPGSAQTQLNLSTDIDVRLNDEFTLRTGIAFPLLKRNINVDGLTRAFSLTLGLIYFF